MFSLCSIRHRFVSHSPSGGLFEAIATQNKTTNNLADLG